MSKKSKLNAENPEHLIFKGEDLTIEVMGGIRLDGLDRLRATLKIEHDLVPVRHNLDLYNDNQLDSFIRKASEKLELNTYVISEALLNLINELESYRLKAKEEQEYQPFKKKKLTPTQRKVAESFLKSENLMQKTNELIGQSGVIGEESNRLLMYIIFTSRLTYNPLHIISFGASGSGKSHLQEKVSELIPEEDKMEITVLSENAFYYFGQQELKHKLILIEDLDGADNVLYPLREIQSKKRITKTIAKKDSRGETRTTQLKVEGPLSIAGCTTREKIYEDNSNRSFLIYINETGEQDHLIMNYQRALSANKINSEAESQIKTLLQNTQRVLQPMKVVNPWAELLMLPASVFKPRRTNMHYLQFIEAITFYHQLQREPKADENTGEIYIETTLEDIEEANKLLKHILLRKSDELTGTCRDYFETLKTYTETNTIKTFTSRDISIGLRKSLSTIKRYHQTLNNHNYLKITKKTKYGGFEYKIISFEEYENLQNTIVTVLDSTLAKLKAAHQSKAAQLESEPL